MGFAHLRTGDIEQAVDELMAAVRSNPEDTELAIALEEALERFTQPISQKDLEGDERGAGDPAQAREDEWEATRMNLIAQDGFDIERRNLSPSGKPASVSRAVVAMHRPEEPFALAQDAVVNDTHDPSTSDGESSPTEAVAPRVATVHQTPARDEASEELPAPALAVVSSADLRPAPEDPSVLADPHTSHAAPDAQPEAGEPDQESRRVELPGVETTSRPQTVIRRGKTDQPTSLARRMRTTTFAAAALIGAITLGLGAVTTFRSARGGAQLPPQATRSSSLTPPAPVLVPEEAASLTLPADAAAPEPAAADPTPRASRAGPRIPEPVETETIAEVTPAEVTTEAPVPQPIQGPSYEFMNRLGLPVPPGGILDAENSDTRMLLFDAKSERHPKPSVLTFRTAAGIEEVLAFYAASGIHGFRPRTVQMGGEFQGVERTVARASARGVGGREVTITVSHPGVDRAARRLVPETTIRFELF